MDYFFVGIRAFTYVIFFSFVKIIVPKLLGEIKQDIGKNGIKYFDKKPISNFFLGVTIFLQFFFHF